MIILIILVIVAISIISLLLYGFAYLIKTSFFDSKNWKEIEATITDVKRDDRVNKFGYVEGYCYKIMCKFNYNGEVLEKELYNDYTVTNVVKNEDKVKAFYNSKKDIVCNVEPVDNSRKVLLFLLFFLALIILIIFCNIHFTSDINQFILLLISSMAFFGVSIYLIKENFYINGNNYIEVIGTITNIHERNDADSEDGTSRRTFFPEIEFNYNGQKKTFIGNSSIKPRKTHVGDSYKVYYDPKKDCIHGKTNNIFISVFVIIGFLFLFAALKYLLKL